MQSVFPAELSRTTVEALTRAALNEDLGRAGDITSLATLAPSATATAKIVAREPGTIAGLLLAETAFHLLDPATIFSPKVQDAAAVTAGQTIATASGSARHIMSAERVALNFLNHLSGIATLTRKYVDAAAGTGTRICDTRKTVPGLRALQKYAVRCGGGSNHRFGLDDAILIKDNHIAVAGGVAAAIRGARAYAGHLVMIEIEVDTLAQLEEALAEGAGAILLDNMDDKTLTRAVAINKGRARLEASGGVTLERIAAIAATGVDYISTSRITMAAPPLDLGLDISISV